MDLATELGEQGFKYIFIIHGHGGPSHNLALEQAADFFNDTYGATMVNLSNLLPTAINFGVDQTEDEAIENGFGIHASMEETSWLLYLQPHLVDKNYRNAVPQSWADTKSLKDSIATQPNWPGYFGSPRLATAGLGKKSYEKISFVYRQLVIDILNQKVEPDTILRYTSVVKNDPGAVEVTRLLQEEENRRKQKQMEWLKKKELQ